MLRKGLCYVHHWHQNDGNNFRRVRNTFFFLFYAPERTSDVILKSHRPSVTIRVSAIIKKTDKGNLLKLYQEIMQNKKVCRAKNLGSHDQGQGHNQRSKVCYLQTCVSHNSKPD